MTGVFDGKVLGSNNDVDGWTTLQDEAEEDSAVHYEIKETGQSENPLQLNFPCEVLQRMLIMMNKRIARLRVQFARKLNFYVSSFQNALRNFFDSCSVSINISSESYHS